MGKKILPNPKKEKKTWRIAPPPHLLCKYATTYLHILLKTMVLSKVEDQHAATRQRLKQIWYGKSDTMGEGWLCYHDQGQNLLKVQINRFSLRRRQMIVCNTEGTFITQDPSPVEVANTLPGRAVTRAVFAAWVWDTLITQRALPAVGTTVE